MYQILLISYRTRKYMHVINQVLNIFFFLTQRIQTVTQRIQTVILTLGYQPKPSKLEFVEGFSAMVVL